MSPVWIPLVAKIFNGFSSFLNIFFFTLSNFLNFFSLIKIFFDFVHFFRVTKLEWARELIYMGKIWMNEETSLFLQISEHFELVDSELASLNYI